MILADKRIVITGGTGSLGKTLTRRILSGELGTPKKVIIFSRDEAKQHDIRISYLSKSVVTDEVIYRNFMSILEMRIGDIRDYANVCSVVKDADIVFNAASLKQVPTCEYFPVQALQTNCIGAYNIARAIEENDYPVETVVGISTDKACKPVSVMGMTKSIQERIFIAANIMSPKTRFTCVRYGNVLASRGSVIPLFLDQIRNGGPVTITVPEMTRFLLSLDEAVDTIFAAVRHADSGDIYVPGAPSTTVLTLAQALIGDRKIDTVVTGIRPGEKMHEIMVSEDEVNRCFKNGDYYTIRPMLPELRREGDLLGPCLQKEFSSADVVLGYEDAVALLKKHNLLI
ncbi:MAG: polysaccharide biosynthesis protein [Syntrophobacterales bacterium]|jgi:UDP-glucose 4-epimerase|nr:polysaccharide biosynthesis protein [Syntrophobacterales bacterium]